jgi:hypothetical protein
MSLLPAGRPLHSVVPDLDELLEEPDGYLRRAPVEIGPRRMYGLSALFAVPGLALLLSCAWTRSVDGERLAMGVGLLLGAGVWLGWSVLMRGHRLVLHPEGVEVIFQGTTVWALWALFNADGAPFVADSDSPRVGLKLPVAPEAVPFVELRRDGSLVAQGAQVKARQWLFTGSDEVVLPARYEATAGELGALLLGLGRRLGRALPRGAPPPEAYAVADLDAVPAPDPAGWVTVSLTRLAFPARCCLCEEATGETLHVTVDAGWDHLVGPVVEQTRQAGLDVPLCPSCRDGIRARQARGSSLGLRLGALLGAGAAGLYALARGAGDVGTLLLFALGGVAVGGIVGFLAGTSLARDLPVQVRGYSPAHGTLSIRFRNPAYTARVLEAMKK